MPGYKIPATGVAKIWVSFGWVFWVKKNQRLYAINHFRNCNTSIVKWKKNDKALNKSARPHSTYATVRWGSILEL